MIRTPFLSAAPGWASRTLPHGLAVCCWLLAVSPVWGAANITNTSPLADGIIGQPYNVALTFTHTSPPNVFFGISAGSLPPGLTLSPNGGCSFTPSISGTPTTAGTYTVTIRVAEADSNCVFYYPGNIPNNTYTTLTITIAGPITITTTTLPATTQDRPYSQAIATSGGANPKTFALNVGSLPAGMSLDTSTGAITGTPTASGTSNFTIGVSCCGSTFTDSRALSILVNPPVSITTSALAQGTVSGAYSQTMAATGGTGALNWSATGLPGSLSISSSGVITGTANAAGTYNVNFTAQDSVGATGSATLALTVVNPPVISTSSLPIGTSGVPYTHTMQASGGVGQLAWTATGLPAGLSLSAAGVISGTPGAHGTLPVQFTVTDTFNSTGTATLNLTISPPLQITTEELPSTTVGRPYSFQIAANGGTGALTWTGVTLPPGTSLSSTGVLNGTTTQVGAWPLQVSVTDALNGPPKTRHLSLVVNALPSIVTPSLPSPVAGTAYSQTLQATGGTAPLTWSATGLPAGLIVSAAGVISGTPTASGQFTATVTVTDAAGATATRQFGVDSAAGFTIQTIPAGQRFLADGQQYTAPHTFHWSVGSTHIVTAVVPAPLNADTRFAFGNWSDSGDFTHSITVTGPGTLTVTYVLQHRVQTAFTPPFAGSVTLVPPSPDGFYSHGTAVGAQAEVKAGFRFLQWGGPMVGNVNPGSMIVTGPGTVFANFQQAPACEYALARNELPVLPSGYSGRVEMTTAPGCAWSAATAANWITIRSAHGSGIGSVLFDVAPNPGDKLRSGVITVAGQTLTVHQDGSGCTILINPSSLAAPVEGGTYTVDVTAPAACGWVAAGSPSFVQLPSVERTGSQVVSYGVTRNSGILPRTAAIVVGGMTKPILQKAAQMTELYRDVPSTHAFHDAIYLATLHKLTAGCGPDLYCPDQPLNRAEMAEFIIKALLGKEVYTADTPYFSDVPATHPQFRVIQKMKELGITSGCSATAYCPGATTTRTEMAVFLTRAKLGLMAGQPMHHAPAPFFDDVPAANPFFGFVQKMREMGITTGCSATSYCPNATVTKGQMAMFVVRGLLTR
ncbi:MAG: putative Ig domain-containing protein [Bryobacterales bacterium]|nr:putative Ig domain-containing protein [Bryobacterales bacterium]